MGQVLAPESLADARGAGSRLTPGKSPAPVPKPGQEEDYESLLPEVTTSQVTAKVQAIYDQWGAVADTNPRFEKVVDPETIKLAPYTLQVLGDPTALQDLMDMFKIIPHDPFYAGGHDGKGFVAFLRHYLTDIPRLHKAAEVARKKLKKFQGVTTPTKAPRAEAESAAARKRDKDLGAGIHDFTDHGTWGEGA